MSLFEYINSLSVEEKCDLIVSLIVAYFAINLIFKIMLPLLVEVFDRRTKP